MQQDTDMESLRVLTVSALEEEIHLMQANVQGVKAEQNKDKLRAHAIDAMKGEQINTRKLRLMAARLAIRQGADVNTPRRETTPISHAVQMGDASLVRILVEAGVAVNQATTTHGVTPLFIVA